MPKYVVLIVNGNPEEQSRIVTVLNPFEASFRIVPVINADEAERKLYEISETEERLALVICDESLPRESGTSFLVRLHQDSRTRPAHKVLVMHEPDAEVLVQAINHGGLDHCLVPPWSEEQLAETVKNELTDFILDHESDKLAYASVLDQERILGHMHEGGLTAWDHHH
ncbi:MAG: hypothetical protein VX610_04715 [SAR324 cluster bacterium]|nr:hypothetical protein [SAR324 cluster bacterium]